MDIDDYKLVDLVKRCNVIYDKNHGQHKNKFAKFEAFKQIAATLNSSAELCESRWCLLRNRFCLELRHIRTADPSAVPRRPWPLFQHMRFLSKFIYPRKTRTMLLSGYKPSNFQSQMKSESDYSFNSEIKEESEDFELNFKDPPEEIETTPSLSISDSMDYLKDNNSEEDIHVPVATMMDEEDEDTFFGKMIAKYLKRVKDVDKKIQIKIEMMKVLKTSLDDG
ncbi:transcription factor Adf-1-like [Diabrotica virgifera virgifera]|uniref:MADF domain-containing protein n=1 Tax=Diabrotica virgifera virgifera TaxID=50390 RepID=A0ABM5J075_DIAVI|nr:transcription factor Adf-1-like [Diabrotica virgifera virgifera]